jgi:hypothetical protein
MALLSFVESAPRAYRLKVGNADLFRNSTEPGTSPRLSREQQVGENADEDRHP